jgi:hypothetical protein
MSNRFEEAGKRARQETNEELSDKLANVTRFSSDEIKKLLPTPASQESLTQLIAIVNSATTHNEQVAAFKQKIDVCAEASLTLVKAFMKIA